MILWNIIVFDLLLLSLNNIVHVMYNAYSMEKKSG